MSLAAVFQAISDTSRFCCHQHGEPRVGHHECQVPKRGVVGVGSSRPQQTLGAVEELLKGTRFITWCKCRTMVTK